MARHGSFGGKADGRPGAGLGGVGVQGEGLGIRA